MTSLLLVVAVTVTAARGGERDNGSLEICVRDLWFHKLPCNQNPNACTSVAALHTCKGHVSSLTVMQQKPKACILIGSRWAVLQHVRPC